MSTPRIVRSSNHCQERLSPVMTASMLPARPKPWREHDRVELRLTASFQLQHGDARSFPGFPGSSACSVLRARDLEPSEQRSFSRRYRPGVKVVNLPLTPSVALPPLGFTGFDSPPREEVPGPLPLAAPSKAARFPGPERLVCDQFEPRAQPRMTLNLVDVACPARWKPH
jgi:hypothetical protein